ncbi:hypothetical protein GCS56_002273 [Vibrio metschnikovii]|uniref:hypothetical protein n=1 Tax=Vibrio TaxID=662 RepID=UPI000DA6961D|nr:MULTISPECIES: hypothetical protein [Vibrio]EKO3924997.1 hypothetical protein [Vibrio metschnikovii]EKP4402811.1 hypothetical protein [Vibrio parahaemolyticus]MBY7864228.1 hypothetical protein [Vibrio fluvialis]MCG6368742.1 hypothetical protein [Vibrio fluvialis]MCG6377443.1 hypothetical protein [Vibrio fluvialis]
MSIGRFDFSCIGWDGRLDSVLEIFAENVCYEIAPNNYRKPRTQIELESTLESSLVLDNWQDIRQRNIYTPVFNSYQREYKKFDFHRYSELKKEIREKGVLLPKGQLLFRGVCSDNQNDAWTHPVSTTLSPYIAVYHALKNGYGKHSKVYVIETPLKHDFKAIYGPFGKDHKFGHEFELLVYFNRRPTTIETKVAGGLEIHLLRW